MDHILLQRTISETLFGFVIDKRIFSAVCKQWQNIAYTTPIMLPADSDILPHPLVPDMENMVDLNAMAIYLKYLPGRICIECINENNDYLFCENVLRYYKLCDDSLITLWNRYQYAHGGALLLNNPSIDFIVSQIGNLFLMDAIPWIQWPNPEIYKALLPLYCKNNRHYMRLALREILSSQRYSILESLFEPWISYYLPYFSNKMRNCISRLRLGTNFVLQNYKYLNITNVAEYSNFETLKALVEVVKMKKICRASLSERFIFEYSSKFDYHCWNLISRYSDFSLSFALHDDIKINFEIYKKYHPYGGFWGDRYDSC